MQPLNRKTWIVWLGLMAAFLALQVYASRVIAEPAPLAPCYPSQVDGSGTAAVILSSDLGYSVTWYCDVGHRWHGVYRTLPAAKVPSAAQIVDYITQLKTVTSAQLDAWSVSNVTLVDMTDPLIVQAASVPWPNDPPASGWVTQSVDVYKQRDAVNGVSFIKIGTVALGVPCSPAGSVDNKYYLIDRSTVKMASRFDTLPLKVYGLCR